jgi:hypothetical protein
MNWVSTLRFDAHRRSRCDRRCVSTVFCLRSTCSGIRGRLLLHLLGTVGTEEINNTMLLLWPAWQHRNNMMQGKGRNQSVARWTS